MGGCTRIKRVGRTCQAKRASSEMESKLVDQAKKSGSRVGAIKKPVATIGLEIGKRGRSRGVAKAKSWGKGKKCGIGATCLGGKKKRVTGKTILRIEDEVMPKKVVFRRNRIPLGERSREGRNSIRLDCEGGEHVTTLLGKECGLKKSRNQDTGWNGREKRLFLGKG